jgi:hypothetical protein
MDKLVARERTKRRMTAARLRSNYKYKDPAKIPVRASERTEKMVRPAPFAQARSER